MSLRIYRDTVKKLAAADSTVIQLIEDVHRGIGDPKVALAALQGAKKLCRRVHRAGRRIWSIGGDRAVARAYLAASPRS
jgi:hypothetical protein